ncbi:glycoside hydrolase family 64 protein [Kitasatospora sp. NPDC101176]|uniref:glycoside hydrolase family 64 protein n=1 Tax=Kitasatospora sp. NPDC101176 TaxID=3364099 RepID=UPI003827B299
MTVAQARPARYRSLLARTALVAAVVLATAEAAAPASRADPAADPAPYRQSADVADGKLSFAFASDVPVGLVDVHYTQNGTGQQDLRMDSSDGRHWTKTVPAPPAAAKVGYWFTYGDDRLVQDTSHFTDPGHGDQGSGTFPLVFSNDTKGAWRDDQIWVTVLGQREPGRWSYLKPDGTLAPIDHDEEKAPGHLTKNGHDYAAMSFTLAQAKDHQVTLPDHLEGGRAYVSLGAPMYLGISPDDKGWAGPDLHNPGDPNADVFFDWYEFTYQHGVIPFGGNTTQVDMFGFPMTARLEQQESHFDQKVGITESRAQVYAQYANAVGPAFKGLADQYRILAPRSAGQFAAGAAQGDYLKKQIDDVWSEYRNQQFTLTRSGQTFTGRVGDDGLLHFAKDGKDGFTLREPTTQDVVQCSGALASQGMNTTELELGAEFCAAFNRGVASDTSKWHTDPSYYPANTPANDYSDFFHQISVDHRTYGFAYDDVNDQSSVKILPNADPPTRLTIGIGW